MENERWLPIPDYEGRYEASDIGNVRSFIYGEPRVMKTPCNHLGYPALLLTKDGKSKWFNVHVLIALTFIGKRPDGLVINHINGNRADNRLCNLEYTDQQRNTQVGRNAKLTPENILDIKTRITNREKNKDIAADYGVDVSTISHIKRGQRWWNITQESAS